MEYILFVITLGISLIIFGIKIGKWGFQDLWNRPNFSSILALILIFIAANQLKNISPQVASIIFYISAIVLLIIIILTKVLFYGTWNTIGLDMRKIHYIRNVAFQRAVIKGGSLSLVSELIQNFDEEDDWRIRRFIIYMLATRPSEIILLHLEHFMRDEHPSVKIMAIKKLYDSAKKLLTLRKIDKTKIEEIISKLKSYKKEPGLETNVITQIEKTIFLLNSLLSLH